MACSMMCSSSFLVTASRFWTEESKSLSVGDGTSVPEVRASFRLKALELKFSFFYQFLALPRLRYSRALR